ncbi:hypothetical protein F511_20187 [Dorcoceras hygrometricum]|uniref:Glycosyl hydrolase family 32 N-terminal domain-containing protein n=1 Tax=Dorcoceras hygrometricum TaxID=472368 RepID=A0A2Z7DFL9_9LAMI|nr:hypothetical protein F511_20187 [Dorcoceras hygrometricum]
MEATAVAHPLFRPISTSKRIHTIPRFTHNQFSSILLGSGSKNLAQSLACCSAKSNINKDNVTNESFTDEQPILDSRIPRHAVPTSSEAVSSNISFSRGLVFDLGSKNSWDSVEIGSPVVKRYLSDEEERWYMWYYGRCGENPDCDSIGLAMSSNGVHWERGAESVRSNADAGLVMKCSEDWWAFDTHSIRPCEVSVMSSSKVRANSAVYWLYYTGFNSEKIEALSNHMPFSFKNPDRIKILKSLPGLAMSQDGRHWARIEGEHHSGALLDVGSDGEWDSSFIASPQVVFHSNGDLRMYYYSFDVQNGHFAAGIARSRDGIRWLKLGKIMGGGAIGAYDECGIVNPRVLRNKKDGRYLMVYEGVALNGKRSIGMAVSSDGLKNWERLLEGPVFEQSSEGGWDCEGVGMPYLVQMDGDAEEWRLYYRGIGEGGRTGIGLAVSQGSEAYSFQRWTGFHL